MKANQKSARCTTGVAGLDEILRGGLPRHRLYLVQGNSGVGKTTLALQFLLEGVRLGEKTLYFALSETHDEILEVAESHGWSLDNISIFELSAMQQQRAQNAQNTLFHPADIELNTTTEALLKEVDRVKPSRVVFDSLSEMRLLADNPLRYRRQTLAMKQYFVGKNCTVMLLDDRTGMDPSDHQVQSIAHGVITLEKRPVTYGKPRRTITVDKVRGVKYNEGQHDYVIETGGVVVFPRLIATEHPTDFTDEPISSGVKELDSLLGGGLDRGTSTLIIGPAGTGKSSIAFQHAIAAAERGEKSMIFLFDEHVKTITSRAAALGPPIEKYINSGMITICPLDPAEISPGEFAARIRSAVLEDDIRVIVLDSLSGYLQAMPDEKFLMLQLHELLSFLRNQGAVALITMAQHGLVGPMKSPLDATYIADTVIMLRYFESEGRVKKALSVVKKRSGQHEDTIREFRLEPGGIRVGPPMVEFHGVLTGVPTYHGSNESILKHSKEI